MFGSMKTGVKITQKNTVGRMMTAVGAAPPWMSRRVCYPDTNTHVHALLKQSCCSVAGSPLRKFSVNYHEKTGNICFDKKGKIA